MYMAALPPDFIVSICVFTDVTEPPELFAGANEFIICTSGTQINSHSHYIQMSTSYDYPGGKILTVVA